MDTKDPMDTTSILDAYDAAFFARDQFSKEDVAKIVADISTSLIMTMLVATLERKIGKIAPFIEAVQKMDSAANPPSKTKG